VNAPNNGGAATHRAASPPAPSLTCSSRVRPGRGSSARRSAERRPCRWERPSRGDASGR
jgi:hypothetical protein